MELYGSRIELGNRALEIDSGQPRAKTPELDPFGPSGAARYDIDSLRMSRRYKSAHAIQNELVCDALAKTTVAQPVVLDLGCGTANDGLDILSKTSDTIYFGLDHSTHMLEQARNKLTREGFRNRSVLLTRDFRFANTHDLSATLEKISLARQVSAVVSALALHHYELAEKHRVYTLAYDLLPRQGLFVLTDLFSNGIYHCAKQALKKEIVDLRKTLRKFGNTNDEASMDTTLSEHHYLEENRPQVLFDEVALLADIGFAKIDLVYRHGQLGVIAAER